MTTVRDVMTHQPYTLDETGTLGVAAKAMAEHDIGAVLVTDDEGSLIGIVTDRDLAIRGLAAGHGSETPLSALLDGGELAVVAPGDDLTEVVTEMKRRTVRRIPVVENGAAVGIVSLADMALNYDVDDVVEELVAAAANE